MDRIVLCCALMCKHYSAHSTQCLNIYSSPNHTNNSERCNTGSTKSPPSQRYSPVNLSPYKAQKYKLTFSSVNLNAHIFGCHECTPV
ncbi:hypothetical protein L211DRAFT_448106 [Terfezia boudieri ATCC MYA-4762]|uniref:Uncharacterized protein n=1 Tax=Terfezia boudieri ATCC MYA-4762 TaxID=1051890 RepID=A0A3N4LIM6_9PEZI|nr:hypothetical protein L211DRAFT_448106 [Terfezia boudieri ATCC MYA-4762]